EFSNQNNFV
nr:Chain A, Major prion protein [Homo sapiens]